MSQADDGVSTPAPSGPVVNVAYTPRYRPLWNNLITQGGMLLSGLALLGLLTFGLFSVVAPRNNPYVDVIGFLVIPIILFAGLCLMPVGILFKSWRIRRKDPTQALRFRFPQIDLNDPSQRRVAKVFLIIGFVMLPIMAVSGYHGYHYTDSVEFCGTACHEVMSPQMFAFERSPHARVSCAECHIGSGAGWYVKSKLSGTRQVLAVMRNSFPRPIPPAITELRPARETCEHCHWPQKFFGSQLREIVHYASDEENTMRRIDMLLKTGGGDESFGSSEGIHRHMALQGSIEYVATDEFLQEIPWVKWTKPSGEELIYRSDGKPSSDPKPEGHARAIDCMDCHNRPAHKFQSPEKAVNVAMFARRVDPKIPYIKREAVKALLLPHETTEAAKATIGAEITRFYQENYPEFFASDRDAIYRAIDAIRDVYEHSFFPTMNVDWRTYPDNIGHLNSSGCFRCHDDHHVDQYGKPISHECGACHDFLNTAENGASPILERGHFKHPYPLGPDHQKLQCSQCHTGGYAPQPSCEGCHVDQQNLYAGTVSFLEELDVDLEPNIMFESASCSDCHDTSAPHDIELVSATCVECHDEDYAEILGQWLGDVADARSVAASSLAKLEESLRSRSLARNDSASAWLAKSQEIFARLEKSGGQHNPDLAVEAYEAISDGAEQLVAERTQVSGSK